MSGGFVELVGAGPGGEAEISVGALRAIQRAEEIWASDLGPMNQERAFLRDALRGKRVVNLSGYYEIPNVSRDRIYRMIAQRLVHLAGLGRKITFVFSGNPFVWVNITDILKEQAAAGRLDLRIIPSMSFLDVIWLGAPFGLSGAVQVRASLLTQPPISPEIDCVVGQVGDSGRTGESPRLDDFVQEVARLYPASHRVFVSGGHPVHAVHRTEGTTISELARVLPTFSGMNYVVILPGVRRNNR